MGNYKLYVIDNLNNAGCHVDYFDTAAEALKRYREHNNNSMEMPVLGIQAGNGSLDLIHGINGENILVPDYRRSTNLSQDMMNILDDVDDIVHQFILDGVVSWEYCITPIVDSVRVTVPIPGNSDGYQDGYCQDKVLKTSRRTGRDAIDSLFVNGHGWVSYKDLWSNPDDYAKDGVLKVEALNVVYVLEKKVVGIDGRMDVHPADFARMVNNISKPFALIAYDDNDYSYQYKDQHNYIVGSHDNISDAVKAWYDIKLSHSNLNLYVGHAENGRESAVFNGMDDNFQAISYEEAAITYGFEEEKTVDRLIRDATNTAKDINGQNDATKRSLDSFDIDRD